MIKTILGMTALASTVAVATPAAAVYQYLTFNGTLNNNSKTTAANTFGYAAANTSLTNQSFAITLAYDAASFANSGNCGSTANAACTFNFTLSSTKTITETIKVNGVEKTYVLDNGEFTLNASGTDQFSFSLKNNQVSTFSGQFTSSTANGFFPNQMAVNNPIFNVITSPLALSNSYFTQNTTSFYAQANSGAVTSLTANNGAVPEPTAWVMMVAGFGALGLVMRRRRATPAISFA